MKIIFNLEIKTVLYLKYNRIKGLVGVLYGKAEQPALTRTAMRANKKLILHVPLSCGSLSITTPVSLLANELDVQSIIQGQVSLAAVNQICAIHEAMNRYKNLRFIKDWKCKYCLVFP